MVFHQHLDGGERGRCPHCASVIPEKGFNKLRDAMFCLEEVNKDFRKAHSEYGKTLFQAEIKSHYVPNYKFND